MLLQLATTGYSVVSYYPLDRFIDLSHLLGRVLGYQDVTIIRSSERYLEQAGPIPLHSDSPEADVIAWYCTSQDEEDGTSLLLDTSEILIRLQAATCRALTTIKLPYFDWRGGGIKGYASLLSINGDHSSKVYYAPWLLPKELSERQRHAVAIFQRYILSASPRRVRLQPGQCLFVNNWRILHGRDRVSQNSGRLLKRVWLQTWQKPEERWV